MHYICSSCRKNFVSKATQPQCTFCGNVHNLPTHSQVFAKEEHEFTNMSFQEKIEQLGRYQIVGELGRGGMGVVYKAYDTQLKRIVALKVILSGKTADKKTIDRFYREAQATAKLKHPHIVSLYDVGSEQGTPYFAMDFIEGLSLKEYAKEKTLSIKQIVELMTKVCQAIKHAHNQGIIHRDLKPANIMISKDGEPYIMDFGLAKVANASQQLSKSGTIIGTLQYMPPEQADGLTRDIDTRSDIYSLGATLYELLTGTPPFKGHTTAKILNQVLNKKPLAPTKIKKTIPKKLENVCLKALQKKKEHRYANVGEMINALTGNNKTSSKLPGGTLILFLTAIIGGIVYMFYLYQKPNIKQENSIKKNKKTKKKLNIAQDWPRDLWEKCWHKAAGASKGYMDFTQEKWLSLDAQQQKKYAKAYQNWYAQEIGKPKKAYFIEQKAKFFMALIPPGKFKMGSRDPGWSYSDEKPMHSVLIKKPFWMTETEITQKQWQIVLGDRRIKQLKKEQKNKNIPVVGEQKPMVCINWKECKTFAKKVRMQLPSESQWEYACRSGNTKRFYWGEKWDGSKLNSLQFWSKKKLPYTFANAKEYNDVLKTIKVTIRIKKVKSFQENNFGLYDMLGNVWEWCLDYYHPNYFGAPKDGSVWRDGGQVDPQSKKPLYVNRGGSFKDIARDCRPASRYKNTSKYLNEDMGFRLLKPVFGP